LAFGGGVVPGAEENVDSMEPEPTRSTMLVVALLFLFSNFVTSYVATQFGQWFLNSKCATSEQDFHYFAYRCLYIFISCGGGGYEIQ